MQALAKVGRLRPPLLQAASVSAGSLIPSSAGGDKSRSRQQQMPHKLTVGCPPTPTPPHPPPSVVVVAAVVAVVVVLVVSHR